MPVENKLEVSRMNHLGKSMAFRWVRENRSTLQPAQDAHLQECSILTVLIRSLQKHLVYTGEI